jgi:hypothetical protein
VGTASIDLAIEKGKYKLYYLRIENEQRIMSNSRLEVLGSSSTFSINKMTTDESQMNGQTNKGEDHISYEESYSYADQDSYNRKQRLGSPYSMAESSLDSAVLMR